MFPRCIPPCWIKTHWHGSWRCSLSFSCCREKRKQRRCGLAFTGSRGWPNLPRPCRRIVSTARPPLSVPANPPDTIQAFYTSAASFLLPSEEEKADRNKSENGIVSQAEHYIHTNYAQPISLALVAEKIDVSPNYLSSLFHKELGESYSKYVTRVRMEHAKRIMKENPGLRIYEIVNQVGYVSVKHFSYVFKQLFGVTPGEYQQSLKAD